MKTPRKNIIEIKQKTSTPFSHELQAKPQHLDTIAWHNTQNIGAGRGSLFLTYVLAIVTDGKLSLKHIVQGYTNPPGNNPSQGP